MFIITSPFLMRFALTFISSLPRWREGEEPKELEQPYPNGSDERRGEGVVETGDREGEFIPMEIGEI